VLIAGASFALGRFTTSAPASAGNGSVAETSPASTVNANGISLVSYSSTTDAVDAFIQAQRQMQDAAAFLAEQQQAGAPGFDADMYRARLAALDGMVTVSRAALYEAPADPVINQYYLATLGAREATMRQIGRALPAGTQVTPY
jgi:hypothetical protein